MRLPFLSIPAIGLLLLLSNLSADAQNQLLKHQYPKIRDTSVTVETLFGTAAQNGTVPYRVTIRNNSGKDRTWTITLGDGASYRRLSTEVVEQFFVEDGSEVAHEILVPMAPTFSASTYRNIRVSIAAPGLPPTTEPTATTRRETKAPAG